MAKLSRFENIELKRPRREEPKGAEAQSGRFDAVDAAPAAPETIPAVGLGRFEEPRPESREVQLELAERRSALDMFTRCARCEADNQATAEYCCRCGYHFDTPEQRAFSVQWRARREEEMRLAAEQEDAALQRKLAAMPVKQDLEGYNMRWVLPERLTRWWPRHKAPGTPLDGEPFAFEWLLARGAGYGMALGTVVSLVRAVFWHGSVGMVVVTGAVAVGLLVWTREPW